jgi:hypothetical protein
MGAGADAGRRDGGGAVGNAPPDCYPSSNAAASAYLDAIASGDLYALACSDADEWASGVMLAKLRLYPVRPGDAASDWPASHLRGRDSVHDHCPTRVGRDPLSGREGKLR